MITVRFECDVCHSEREWHYTASVDPVSQGVWPLRQVAGWQLCSECEWGITMYVSEPSARLELTPVIRRTS